VVIDPTTEEQPALRKAAAFADHVNADLELLTCIYDADIAHVQWVTGHDLEHIRDATIGQHLEVLRELADSVRGEGREVSYKVVWDAPLHEAIVREALRLEPDFVVKDTHHHSAISRALFTNTDWHLIRECPFSLWFVKPAQAAENATVMAAVDPTHEHDQPVALDRRIIQEAQILSAMFEERLHLVHAFDLPPTDLGGAFASPTIVVDIADDRITEKTREVHATALNNLAADIGFPAEQIHLSEGAPVTTLPSMAEELNANIVVMGAVARSRLQRAVVGSTAESTLDRFSCDVVVVKPDGFKSPIESTPEPFGYIEKTGDNVRA
jgi:universal stress protein E